MSFNCVLIDDEPYALELLAHHVHRIDDLVVVGKGRDTEEAARLLQQQRVDLMFLDIKMPGGDGIRFLSGLAHPPAAILTTAYRDYALEGYELGVVDYLLKPISFVRFTKAVDKFRAFRQGTGAKQTDAGVVVIKSGYELYKVRLDEIVLLESRREYVRIVLASGAPLMVRASMQSMLQHLGPGFVQVHKSYIVPVRRITALGADSLQLGEIRIPVGRTYKKSAEHAWQVSVH